MISYALPRYSQAGRALHKKHEFLEETHKLDRIQIDGGHNLLPLILRVFIHSGFAEVNALTIR
jgi:hypothetical protein